MTETEELDIFTEIVREAVGDPAVVITLETTAKDVPGWDSLRHVVIIVDVEERFGIHLSSQEIDNRDLRNVGDFLRLIRAKLSA